MVPAEGATDEKLFNLAVGFFDRDNYQEGQGELDPDFGSWKVYYRRRKIETEEGNNSVKNEEITTHKCTQEELSKKFYSPTF